MARADLTNPSSFTGAFAYEHSDVPPGLTIAQWRRQTRRAIVVEHHPQGPRLRIAGQRVHHGAVGCLLLTMRHHPLLRVLGVLLAADDLHDWRTWFAIGPQL